MPAAPSPPRPAPLAAPLSAVCWLQRGLTLVALCLVGGAAAAELEERPLAPRSQPAGPTLFTPLAGEQTGLTTTNAYDDPQMWWELHQEFKFGAIGSGVAIGDYDGDARPDVFIVNKTEGGRLFRNLGNWRFTDVTAAAGLAPSRGWWADGVAWARRLVGQATGPDTTATPGVWYQGATFADVNNDGRLDLYLCRFAAPNLLYINQGDGTFTEEAAARGLAISDASNMAAFCDFDRDGWLDVYLQTNLLNVTTSPQGQRDYLFRNNGDGTFTDITSRAGIVGLTQGHSATWWDYDADGWPDMYVANDFAPPDTLYRNNRDGTFTNVIDQVVPTMPHSAMGADLGDVNNDGLIDFLVADMAATNHQKDQRGMARIRTLLNESPAESEDAPQFMRNTLFVNSGRGLMREAGILAGVEATDWTWSVRFEDLDNDGRLDLFFTNGMVRELHNADLVQRIAATENVAEGVRLLRASPPLAEPNYAFRNVADLQFENVSAAWGLDQRGVSFGAAFGDLDGDGDLDLIYTNYEQGASVLRNDGVEGSRVTIALRGTRSNRGGVGAVVRLETAAGVQVRPLVLARGYLSSSEPILHFGLGDESRIRRLSVQWPSGHEQTFHDLSGDRHYIITEPAAPAPSVTAPPAAPPAWFTSVDAASQLRLPVPEPALAREPQPLLPSRQQRRGPGLALGDLDADGRVDLVVGGTAAIPARLVPHVVAARRGQAPTAGAPVPLLPASDVADGPLVLFDANADGQLDLLITKSGAHDSADGAASQPSLLLNQGRSSFAPAPPGILPPIALSAGAAVAGDFDRDGTLDLFLGARLLPGQYPLPARSALLRHHGGRWIDVTDELAPGLREAGLVTSALWSDADGDGWLDLLVAREWGGIQLWRNEQGRRLTEVSEAMGFAAAGSGWWTSLAAADFNGDGRMDYAAGNVGTNTPYQATPQQPVALLQGDFRGQGAPLLVEVYYEGDRLYPRRSRNELGQHLPGLVRRYARNDLFARATVPEILGEDRVAAARWFRATELRSGLFLSQPDGTFRFTPLPHIAQIAPLQGMVAGDFDGDGRADLYAVQNSYAPLPSVGRFAGGLSQLLRGDGHGGLSPIPPQESGLIVQGNAKALVVADLDRNGWPDFLASRNHDTTLAFLNQGHAGRSSLQVTLRGGAGNATGVGARITAFAADGRSQVAEVYAGGGYWSQSGGAVFFGQSDTTPLQRLEVRWPSGRTTSHPVPAGTTAVELPAP